MPSHRPSHARQRAASRRLPWIVGGLVVACVVAAVVVVTTGGGADRAAVRIVAPTPSTTTPASTAAPTTSVASTTTSTTVPLPPAGDAALPQTSDRPQAGTPTFDAEMAALWSAVTTGQAAAGLPAFFPEAAYHQLKSYYDDDADWSGRLLAHYDLDLGAAHALLGAGAPTATLSGVLVPTYGVSWIRPGTCDNRVGYWHVGGARLVYQEGGVERSIGIASMISWRGLWYVVHLGSVTPPSGRGVVASPSSGTGYPGGYGGC